MAESAQPLFRFNPQFWPFRPVMRIMARKTTNLSAQGQRENLNIQTITVLNAFALTALSTSRGINHTLRLKFVRPEPLDEFAGMYGPIRMIRLFVGMAANAIIAKRCSIPKWYFILLARVKIIFRGSLLDRRRSLYILSAGPLAG